MDCAKIGTLIRTLRRERGLTQLALAEKMQISDRAVSKWERGFGCPDVSLLPGVIRNFGCESGGFARRRAGYQRSGRRKYEETEILYLSAMR